eukprot:gene15117-21174_t
MTTPSKLKLKKGSLTDLVQNLHTELAVKQEELKQIQDKKLVRKEQICSDVNSPEISNSAKMPDQNINHAQLLMDSPPDVVRSIRKEFDKSQSQMDRTDSMSDLSNPGEFETYGPTSDEDEEGGLLATRMSSTHQLDKMATAVRSSPVNGSEAVDDPVFGNPLLTQAAPSPGSAINPFFSDLGNRNTSSDGGDQTAIPLKNMFANTAFSPGPASLKISENSVDKNPLVGLPPIPSPTTVLQAPPHALKPMDSLAKPKDTSAVEAHPSHGPASVHSEPGEGGATATITYETSDAPDATKAVKAVTVPTVVATAVSADTILSTEASVPVSEPDLAAASQKPTPGNAIEVGRDPYSAGPDGEPPMLKRASFMMGTAASRSRITLERRASMDGEAGTVRSQPLSSSVTNVAACARSPEASTCSSRGAVRKKQKPPTTAHSRKPASNPHHPTGAKPPGTNTSASNGMAGLKQANSHPMTRGVSAQADSNPKQMHRSDTLTASPSTSRAFGPGAANSGSPRPASASMVRQSPAEDASSTASGRSTAGPSCARPNTTTPRSKPMPASTTTSRISSAPSARSALPASSNKAAAPAPRPARPAPVQAKPASSNKATAPAPRPARPAPVQAKPASAHKAHGSNGAAAKAPAKTSTVTSASAKAAPTKQPPAGGALASSGAAAKSLKPTSKATPAPAPAPVASTSPPAVPKQAPTTPATSTAPSPSPAPAEPAVSSTTTAVSSSSTATATTTAAAATPQSAPKPSAETPKATPPPNASGGLPFGAWRFVRLKKPMACDACKGTVEMETVEGDNEVFQCDVTLQPSVLASSFLMGTSCPLGPLTEAHESHPLPCIPRPKKMQLEGSAKITRSEYNTLLGMGLDIMAATAKKAAPAPTPAATSTSNGA